MKDSPPRGLSIFDNKQLRPFRIMHLNGEELFQDIGHDGLRVSLSLMFLFPK
jgi:hypothetical protein